MTQLGAFLFEASVGDPFKPGKDNYWPAPGSSSSFSYGIDVDGYHLWQFGESTRKPIPSTQNPKAVIYKDKRFILKSMRLWASGSGTVLFKDWETNTIIIKLSVKPGVPLSLLFGTAGVDLGRAPFVRWVGSPGSQRVWIEAYYDTE